MRFLVLTLFINSIFILSMLQPSYAQEVPLSQYKPVQTTEVVEEDPGREERIFAEASDQQINEAQQFYKYCAKNKTMSKIKDCKCAATLYLETRMSLGEEATTKEIMAENVNTCLRDENRDVIEGLSADMSDITDKQLNEAQEVYEHCKGSQRLSKNFDCKCFAARFLDERLETGPLANWDLLFHKFKHECKNIVETTGFEYSSCMSRFGKTIAINIEPKDYCECYARKWAELYKAHKGNVTKGVKNGIKVRARGVCNNPNLYQ